MTFEEILPLIKHNHSMYFREAWGDPQVLGDNFKVITLMHTNVVDMENIKQVKSLSDPAKNVFLELTKTPITYKNQMLIIDNKGNATHWSPTVEDILADDWVVLCV